MVLPQTLPIPQEAGVASYSFTDIASGVGYVSFFGTQFSDNSYNFVLNTLTGDERKTLLSNGLEINFDLAFDRPRTINGNVLFSYTIESGAASGTSSITIKLFHVASGGTETQLGGTATGTDISADAARRDTHAFSVTNQVMKKDEKLRIEWVIKTSTNVVNLWHDPSNEAKTLVNDPQTTAVIRTDMIIDVPFRIDL